MIGLDENNAKLLHRLVSEASGGSVGIRDHNLLGSALEGAFATFGGVELYPTDEEKCVRIGFSLISNHAFIDGNKRIGLLAMLTLLEVNGIALDYTDEELIELGLGVASGRLGYEALLEWVRAHHAG